jgi:hypothetical protein
MCRSAYTPRCTAGWGDWGRLAAWCGVLAAADAYSYFHLLLVSGDIVSAIGLKAAVGHVAEPPANWSGFLPVGGDPLQ